MTTTYAASQLSPPTPPPPVAAARPVETTANATSPTAVWRAPPPLSNPKVRLDPELNIVVLEFYDSNGEMTRKLPTERELRAYTLGRDPAMPGAPAIDRDA